MNKLLGILLLISSCWKFVNSQVNLVRPSSPSPSVGTGNDKRINYYWRETIGTTDYKMHVYVAIKQNEAVHLFNSQGTSLVAPSSVLDSKLPKALIGKRGTGKLLAIYEDQTYYILTLNEISPGSLSLSPVAGLYTTYGGGFKTVAASQTVDTNHVFLLLVKPSNAVRTVKFDYIMTTFNQWSQASVDLGTTDAAPILLMIASEFLIFTDGTDKRIVVEQMGMQSVYSASGQPPSKLYVRNTHSSRGVYFAEDDTTKRIRRYRFDILPFSMVITADMVTTQLVDVGLLNVGTFMFLAAIFSSPNQVVILDKDILTMYGSPMNLGVNNLGLGMSIGHDMTPQGNGFQFSVYRDSSPTNTAEFFEIRFDMCLTRDSTTRVCTACPVGYYRSSLLPDNYCLQKPQFIGGFGADDPNMLMVRCESKGCEDCRDDYKVCVNCKNSAGYYLYLGKCLVPSEFPDGKGVQNSDSVANCQTGCLLCNYDFNVCTKCDTANGYFLDPATSQCVQKASFPTAFGANLVTGQMKPCATGCEKCTDDVFYCTICSSGFFLTPNKICLSNTQLPLGYRINPSTGTLQPCADGCSGCPSGSTTCTTCFVANNYVLSGSKCLLMSLLPDGTGANLGTGVTGSCAVPNCQKCRFDASKCELCFSKYNLDVITFKSCTSDIVTTFLQLETEDNSAKLSKVDVSIYISLDPPLSSAADTLGILNLIRAKLNYSILIIDPEGNQEEIPFKANLLSTKSSLQLDLTFTSAAKKSGNYEIKISSNESFPLDYNGNPYQVLAWSGSTSYTSSASSEDLKAASDQANTLTSLTPPTSSSSASVTLAMFAIISADPTGLLMRISQILQVVSKLAFINVQYGQKLESFLSKIGELFEGYQNPAGTEYIMHTKMWRGKLTKYGVHIDIWSKYALRLTAYLVCWLLKFCIAIVPYDLRLPKWTLHVMFFIPKVHALVFNLVFFDLTFYSSRTLLHSKGLFIPSMLAAVSLVLLALDFASLFGRLFDEAAWRKLYFHLRKSEPPEQIYSLPAPKNETPEQQEDRSHFEAAMQDVPEEFMTSEESENEEEYKHRTSREVDYLKTYTEINFDYHMFDFMSEFLRVDKKVFSNVGARSYYALHVLRIGLYHAIVVCGQYTSTAVLLLLTAMELGKIAYTFYFYFRHKYLKFFVLVLVEISQSIMFGSFLLMVFYFHLSDSDGELADGSQTVGIYLVVMSVAAEYILLLLYVIFMLVHSLRISTKAKEYRRKKNYILGISHPKKFKFEYIHYLSRYRKSLNLLPKTIFVREIAQKQNPVDESLEAINNSMVADSSIHTAHKKRSDRIVQPSKVRDSKPKRVVSKDVSTLDVPEIGNFMPPKTRSNETGLMASIIPERSSRLEVEPRLVQQTSSSGKKGTIPAYLKESGLARATKVTDPNKLDPRVFQTTHSNNNKYASKGAKSPQIKEPEYAEDSPVRRQFLTEIRQSGLEK